MLAGRLRPAAPVIDTLRLRLRPYRLADFAAFADYFASERSRFTDGPVSRGRAFDLFAAGAGRWPLMGYGAWAIEICDSGQGAGLISLNPPLTLTEPELGWILWSGSEGHGYAAEAAKAALNFVWNELGWPTLLSGIHGGNTRSLRLAARLGATEDTTVHLATEPETRFFRFHPHDAKLDLAMAAQKD